MADLLDDYGGTSAWDEMLDESGLPRSSYGALHQALQTLSGQEFADRCAARDRAFRDQGITFSHSGEERLFPLDLCPRVLSAGEWTQVETGVVQRVRALEAFLADVYGEGQILQDGVVPRSCV
ncbi:MAG: circularly permuted type 2 ATP-grasp protein, partial [Acidimicrobiales bacterium]